MTQSMTAFARKEASYSWGSLSWELRAVNHRFLEPQLKIHEALRDIEPIVRDKLRSTLSRGKVECALRFHADAGTAVIEIDQQRVASVVKALEQIKAHSSDLSPIDPLALLHYPGVQKSAGIDTDAVLAAATELLDATLAQFIEARKREGVELAKLIEQRLDAIDQIVAEVRGLMPQILQAQRENLKQRVEQLGVDLDPERLEQEVVMLAQKADVAEELDRLETHVKEVRRAL
ncbi:MAG: YicC family protein, partial [Oceanospirillaceae bacterium]|nr:YicC family protein [Oceanospirillaceae bacterium]